MAVRVIRKAFFNAAHRLFKKEWTDEKNLEVFGKCSYPNFHGHNYVLELSVVGETDPETGYVIDLKKLQMLIQSCVIEKLDHKNLNLDVPELRGKVPTVENISMMIYEQMKPHFMDKDIQVALHETNKNTAIYPAVL
jgi:6-pyruvoyltetrahydropterin/6-carboxytetrahydropterin synthase